MRQFESFVRNFKLEGDRYTNLFEPREPMIGDLILKPGEVYRYLTPKSDFGTHRLSNLQVGLYGIPNECGATEAELLVPNIGFMRRQQSELYYEMVIKVNNAPSDTWKQFALIRPNGQQLFGTFSSQQSDLSLYIRELKVWLETYPHTRVDCIPDGNLLKIRIWENGNFIIRNEKITVGLGTVSEFNTNTPTLTKQLFSTYNRPAYNTSDLVVGSDVTEGNIFTFGDVVYTATKADTAETVKATLLGSNKKVIINVGDSIPINAVVGSTRTTNTNTPMINLLYNDTTGGNDRYKVEVSNVQKGNTFQVTRSGLSPLQKTASDTDTKATIEAFFNATGGFLVVPTGTTVQGSAVPGVRIDENTNNPTIGTANTVLTPAQNTDKYRILIGTSVRKNNKFTLDGTVITADDEDTYLTIASKLNLIDGLYYEVAAGQSFDAFAEKGDLYDEDNIADVQIISSPIRRISQQYLTEITLPVGYDYGIKQYQIAVSLYEYYEEFWEFKRILTVSNFFRVESNPQYTVMLKYADFGEVFGYEYFEEGINQQMRVPLFLKNQRYETTETQSQSVNNATVKGNVQMRKMFDFVVRGYPAWFHKAMQVALNSKLAFIDEKKVSLSSYDVTQDSGAKKIQAANGSLYEDRYLMTNYGKLFLDSDNYKEKISVITNFKGKILCVLLQNDLIYKEISEIGEVYMPVGEYGWRVWAGGAVGETIDMRIYQNGIRIHHVTLLCGRWNKLDSLIRCYPHDQLLFEEVNQDNQIDDIDSELETNIGYESVEYANEIGNQDQLNGYVAPFIAPFVVDEGNWRYTIEDGGLAIQQNVGDDNWVTKSITT
jgi:hypothetical protein